MEKRHTPGPWRWELNLRSKQISLCGGVPKFDLTVMDFERWGMSGACPRFQMKQEEGFNFMQRADEMGEIVEGREHHADWFQSISNPDAALISAAPDLLEALEKILNQTSFMEAKCIARAAITKALTINQP